MPKEILLMRNFIVAATLVSLALPLVPAMAQPNQSSTTAREDRQDAQRDRERDRQDARRDRKRDFHDARVERERIQRIDRSDYRSYDYDRPDPRFGRYEADRYYYSSSKYRARRLYANDRIYRGRDNRYYCRRSDGTTGLIIGGIAGGLLGNAIAPGDSQTLGTLLGVGVGAAVGNSIGRHRRVTCR
jgi:hypothetical protein